MGRDRRSPVRRTGHGLRNVIVLAVLVVAALASIIYVGLGTNGGSVKLVVGDRAPIFSLTSVNGSTFNLAKYQGKSDVLLFFNEGLSCSPCLQQMIDIDRQYSTFSDLGVAVVSITTNSMGDMRAWAQNSGIGNMMVLADQTLAVDKQYDTLYAGSMHAGMAPGHTFILVDKSGDVIWRKDYGSYTMYVQMSELISAVESAAK